MASLLHYQTHCDAGLDQLTLHLLCGMLVLRALSRPVIMKRLTLEEIGRLAGVSRATVSRVINNYPHIRPEIRERVQAVIEQTGFQPNAVARSLASNRTNIAGLIIPGIAEEVFTDPYFPNLITGIAQGCNENGLVLSLYLFTTLEEQRSVIQAMIRAGLVDGLIVTTDRRHDGTWEMLLASHIPLVNIGEPDEGISVSYVDVDNAHGGYLATKHLLEQGYRRIGIVAGTNNKSADRRLEGYQRALREYGVPFDPQLVAPGDFSLDSGYNALKALLPYRPEAVFATNDSMAHGCLRAIREARLSVPDDIALVGFDDLSPAEQADPPLTTIHQPVKQIGVQAVEILCQILRGETHEPQHRILPASLVVRASTGEARAVSANS